ncbi:unnamed protein product [Amoebophrya sp. A25]|nr:unnamed protein product [Amoebophrya sp. A25]|eukprot:GSA25T00027992001.1
MAQILVGNPWNLARERNAHGHLFYTWTSVPAGSDEAAKLVKQYCADPPQELPRAGVLSAALAGFGLPSETSHGVKL